MYTEIIVIIYVLLRRFHIHTLNPKTVSESLAFIANVNAVLPHLSYQIYTRKVLRNLDLERLGLKSLSTKQTVWIAVVISTFHLKQSLVEKKASRMVNHETRGILTGTKQGELVGMAMKH